MFKNHEISQSFIPSEVILPKFLNHQKQEALAGHFHFTSFPTRPFSMYFGASSLHLGSFGSDFRSYDVKDRILLVVATSSGGLLNLKLFLCRHMYVCAYICMCVWP